MSTNSELEKIFNEMAAVLTLTGANPFRVNAHTRVARAIKDLTKDIGAMVRAGEDVTSIEGIGKGSARKIAEYVESGVVTEHRELLEQVPAGLLEVMKIPGLGPKTVQLLWKEAGVTDIPSLQKAIDDGSLAGLPRMGEKSVQNIRDSIAFREKAAERTSIGTALPVAEAIIEFLQPVEGVKKIEYAGSLRRGCETIGDIDLLAVTSKPDVLAETFLSMPGITQVLVQGGTKLSVRIEVGIQVDVRIVPAGCFGAALMYFSGSEAHNVALRELAIRQSMRLNEYGLFPGDDDESPPQQRGITPVAGKTEKSIYTKLGLPYIPPELREDRGELSREVPQLIEVENIRAELHAHTIASDGKLTIDQLADEAVARGFHTIAVTDHSKSSVQANGLSEKRLRAHIDAVREADANRDDIRILAGSEVDILSDGHLDYDDDLLAELDIVVASPHIALKQEEHVATQRLLSAIRHPLVHIVGHPTGRQIGRRLGLPVQIEKLAEAAAEHNTVLEINANPRRLDLRDTHVRAALNAGACIAIDTDAHHTSDFDNLRYGVLTGRRGGLEAVSCINTWTAKKLQAWLKTKR